MNESPQPGDCLAPAQFVDSDAPAVIDFAKRHANADATPAEQAVQLYYAVRDGFWYDPYRLDFRAEQMKASAFLSRKKGHCVEKATLYAAACRAIGIPTRLRFANVRNHIGTARLEEFLQSNLLVFHGYTEVWLDDRWVKATPAFNKELCAHLGVQPLEFDGQTDSLFQEYDPLGGRFMEYTHDYGVFADVPRDLFISSLRNHYGHLFDPKRLQEFGLAVEF